MIVFVTQRLVQGVLVLFLISAFTFFLVNLAPGGPSSLIDFQSTAAQREARLKQYGLDKPVYVRYVLWLSSALKGDLGISINQGLPVASLLSQRFATTLQLAMAALLLATLFGILLGVIAALYRNSWPDHIVSTVSTWACLSQISG